MTQDRRRPPDHSEPPRPSDRTIENSDFEQLALDATVTGPGKRSEDHYEPGAQLKIKGERGVFTYKRATVSSAGQVSLHLVGKDGSRAVRPDRVVPVKKRRPV